MSLASLLATSSNKKKKASMTKERLQAVMPHLRARIAFWREYPDLFIDEIKGPHSKFKFFMYQRIFLRIAIRHNYTYATFSRGFSKSFLSMMVLVIRCILFPGAQLAVSTGGKGQAAAITISKVEEICKLIPPLAKEIKFERGETKKSKDDVQYKFRSGSKLDILAPTESSRGQRRQGLLLEECVLIDQDVLNEILIPTTVVNRVLPNGKQDPYEITNHSQIYITTAGYKNTFAYNKLIEILILSIVDPANNMILGGTYEIPILEGLQPESFIEQQQLSENFKEDSFDREYKSIWGGDSENAFFSLERFDKHRVILQPEYEYSGKTSKNSYYVVAADIGRKGCATEALIFKVIPQAQGTSIKKVVNIYSYNDVHFESQAIYLKKLYFKYKARKLVIDGNGIGIGLLDFMVKSQIDPETGDELPDFGIDNDPENFYKPFQTDVTEHNAVYVVKANASLDTEAFTYVQTQMNSGKVRFLIDEMQAKTKLLTLKAGQEMTPTQRNNYLMPFCLTTALKEQLSNLVEINEGINIKLKQANKGIKKDKFSALAYGLYYIKQEEDRGKRRRSRNIADMLLFN